MHYFTYLIFGLATLTLVNCWPDFYLYNKANQKNHKKVTANALRKVLGSIKCSCHKEFIFIVHGFLQNGNAEWMLEMKTALLDKSFDRTIIVVDWKEGALPVNGTTTVKSLIGTAAGFVIGGPVGAAIVGGFTSLHSLFDTAAKNVPKNGEEIGRFIAESGIDPMSVHCIGHSLGAHSCGFAGKYTKLRRISGMDAAGPRFTNKPANQRLDSSDAEFVDVIHTDGNEFGIKHSIGHVDFYPNGGMFQPHCGFPTCSHSAAHKYYLASIRNPDSYKFEAMRSTDYKTFSVTRFDCDANMCAQMGYAAKDAPAEGNYYLEYKN